MMVAEIAAGSIFGSMALLADGWHMGTHAAALGIAGGRLPVRAAAPKGDARFSFGTGEFGDLAAFSRALILGVIAVEIAYESVLRLMSHRFQSATARRSRWPRSVCCQCRQRVPAPRQP